MKIAFVTSTFFPNCGGAEVQLHLLICELVRQFKVDATLYIPRGLYKKYPKRVWESLPYQVISLKPLLFRFKGIFGIENSRNFLKKEQQKKHFDLWYANSSYPAGYLISIFNWVPRVLICHGTDLQKEPTLRYGLRQDITMDKRIQEVVCKMKALIAISSTLKKDYEQILQQATMTKHVVEIPNFVSAEKFQRKGSKEAVRNQLNLPLDKKIILTVSRNHPKKGLEHIAKIMHHLVDLQKRKDFLWVILGKDVARLAKNADFKKYKDHLLFLPEIAPRVPEAGGVMFKFEWPHPDLIAYYQAADVFVFPSLFESFGVVLIEAMAAGLPVVTSDAPGCRDVVEDRKNGLVIARKDDVHFAAAINEIFSNTDLEKQLAEGGRQTVLKRYDLPICASYHYGLYQELVNEKAEKVLPPSAALQ